MDNADIATREIERSVTHSIKSHSKPSILHNGFCQNCRETLSTDGAFCDADCRDDFEQRKKFKGVT